MSRPIPRLLFPLLALGAAACTDALPPAPAHAPPRAEIVDAAHNFGAAHFFFASPLVKDPAPTGKFDPGLQPVVQVCELTADGCATVVAEFSRERGTGGAVIKVDAAAERYFVNWHTGQCRTGACELDPARMYRLRVLVGGLEAGHADIDVVTTQGQARNVNTNEYIPLVDGKVLQIRFRMEEGLKLADPAAAVALAARFRPLTERYRDRGIKPATGRSGSATLGAQMLLNKDGSTDVEVVVRPGEQLNVTPIVEHVQLKALTAAGDAAWTRNFGEPAERVWTRRIDAGMYGRRQSFRVQANITGIDPSRTDVVTVTGTVARRPDLAVERIDAPAEAPANEPVRISATVRERNGDLGATGRCVLYVDGQRADAIGAGATGMWVDAGDAVGCIFTATFDTEGRKQLRVAIENVAPGDDDPTNNEATGAIDVSSGTELAHYAYVWQYDSHYSLAEEWKRGVFATDGSYESSYAGTYAVENEYHEQGVDMSASLATRLTFPLSRLRLSASTGGVVVYDITLTEVAPTFVQSWPSPDGRGTVTLTCVAHWATESAGDIYLTLCSSVQTDHSTGETRAMTSFHHSRHAYSAVYYSAFTQGWLYRLNGSEERGEESFTFRDDASLGAVPQLAFGPTFDIDLVITDAPAGGTGTRSLVASPRIPIDGYGDAWDWTGPEWCWSGRSGEWYDSSIGKTIYTIDEGCIRRRGYYWWREGSTVFEPSLTP